ncbi:MAG: UbiA family prenyltransferase [Phenylobacterium sp.]|nr:UbiA family prenyltransferase [Phenylobacterium sp.]MDP3175700.1 UbiA family prenyltransferase [Phenylobacterium sp.]
MAVDLDGTLFLGDSLDEGFAKSLLTRPMHALRALVALLRGRASMKEALRNVTVDCVASMPVRAELVDWLRGEQKRGRRVHLVTAADQQVAEAAARRFDFLHGDALGTRDGVNLKGPNKSAALQEAFPDGFTYVGDSRADLPVFAAADSIVLAGAPAEVANAARQMGKPVEAEFQSAQNGVRSWMRALRLHQWSKNLLLFIPLLLGDRLDDPHAVIACVLGFVAVGVTASGTYIINDLSDLAADRAHATKWRRPFASGAIPVKAGLVAAPLLIAAGLAATTLLSSVAGLLLGIYTAVTLAYSFRLKRVPMLDVYVLAALYALRLGVGTALVEVPPSVWLMVFALFFFFSLSLAKRHAELVKAAERITGPIPGRGYRTQDAGLTLAMGVGSAMCSLLIIVLFLVFEAAVSGGYSRPAFLWPAPALIGLWVQRIWLLASRGDLADDPVSFAVRDRPSLVLGVLLIASALLAL